MSGADEPRLELDERPATDDLEILERGLVADARGRVEPRDHRVLAVFARDDHGRILGGLRGATAWSWLRVKHLWVDPALRGRGLGTRLMRAAEREAAARGCRRAWVDTFDFQAVGFYEKLGYSEFGRLEDYPTGRSRIFMWKRGLQRAEAHRESDPARGTG